jgi:hypothetical protein
MTADDWQRLILYRSKRGPLNPTLRMEAGFALVASSVFNAAGATKQDRSHFSPSDFMPWASDDAPMEDTVDNLTTLMAGKRNG